MNPKEQRAIPKLRHTGNDVYACGMASRDHAVMLHQKFENETRHPGMYLLLELAPVAAL